MEENNVSVKSVSIKWGAINGLVGIIFFVLIDLMGLVGNSAVQWISSVIFIILAVLAHREFKTEGDGFMSYGQGLGIGTLVAAISSVISALFTYIYITFVNPSFIDAIKEKSIMDMENRGMSDAEIEQAMSFTESFMSPVAISLYTVFFGIFFGFILALIISIFTKKSRPETI